MVVAPFGEVLMQLFRSQGVEYIFGLPGFTEIRFLNVLEDHPEIKYTMALQENICIGMAEGYTRTSGKVGVVNLHTIAGISSAMGLLLNAYGGGVPLVITAGNQDSRLFAQEPRLWGDLISLIKPLTKWSTEVVFAEDMPRAIQRAFKTALQPPTGPVLVSLPQNLFEENIDFDYVPGTPQFPQLRPDTDGLISACKLIKHAQNPAIVVESGVAKANALSEVVDLAEMIGAPVFQWWMADVNFPVKHPLFLGELVGQPKLVKAVKSADLLIMIGAPQYTTTFYSKEPPFPKTTRIIQIDDIPQEIGKNVAVNVGLQGNIKASVIELLGGLRKILSEDDLQKARNRARLVYEQKELLDNAFVEASQKSKENIPISATRLMAELRNVIKSDTIIVDDCWTASTALRRTLNFSEPGTYLRIRSSGSIGWGIPAALGAKLAAPERQVIAVAGDGSAMWSIQSLWTASHYNIPIVSVICCNGRYGQVKSVKRMLLGEKASGKSLGENIDNPTIDFSQIAGSLGVHNQKVTRPDEIRTALISAIESKKPELIEVYIES